MPHPLRYQSKSWATHHVVSRFVQGYAFMRPTSEIEAITRGVFCYSLKKHKGSIKAHYHSFLSNHFHILLSAKHTKDLARFMCHFKSNLARELARVYGWTGPIWQKRYSSEEILDWKAYLEALKYLTKNSVKEGLVDHPREWTGLHGYHQLVEGRPLQGEWLDRTRLYQAQLRALARGEEVDEREFVTLHEVELTPPPMWEGTREAYQSSCEEAIEEAIEEARAQREGTAMGMARVLAEDVYIKRVTKRRKGSKGRRLCWTKCAERLKAFKQKYREFKAQFQAASATLREAIDRGDEEIQVCFPEFGVPLFNGCRLESAT